MRTIVRHLVLSSACAVGLLPTAGCNIVGILGPISRAAHEAGNTTYPAEYEGLTGRTFAVILQADMTMRMNQPRAVTQLTNAATRVLSQNVAHAGFVPGPRVLEFQFSTPRWSTWEPLRIADELTVDRLVVIELLEYRLHEAGNAQIWDGRAVARVEVYEAEYDSNEPAFVSEVRVRYPDGSGFSRQEISGRQVEANLQQRLVDRCCWLFYEHTLPNTIEY
ncbi:MAG: hypothetical protein Tsb0013_11400 [Phycisphaerales bacterium]